MPKSQGTAVLFGGTFDPPHRGHLAVIQGLRQHTGLPVMVVPTGVPGHRERPGASPRARLKMMELAVRGLADPCVTVDSSEVERCQPSFTIDTVERLRREDPKIELVLAMGMDVAERLPSWRQVGSLLGQVRLLVFRRAGVERAGPALLEELGRQGLPLAGAEVISLPTPEVDGTAIRRRVAAGEDCTELLPPAVYRYIRSHGIYGSKPARGSASSAG
ncbi:MAG: nicotinate (nicotinamide) nucleotide adenylyltransferase [Candidatus Dormibacteria bacterium]